MNKLPSVLSLMLERSRTRSKRGRRTDGMHLAMVVECGGMRGIAAGGFLKVLSEMKMLDSFDTLHGSSSGACAAAFFLTGQFDQGWKVFYEDISTRKVVNPWRFFSQPCMVDTDFIVDEIIGKKRQLDTETIISEPGVLKIVTTSVESGLAVSHSNFQSGEQILRALKATLRVPGPFERGIEIDGIGHIDGGIAAPIPLFSAVGSGATHILIVHTQRIGDYDNSKARFFIEGAVLHLLYGRKIRNTYVAAQINAKEKKADFMVQPPVTDRLIRPIGATACGWSTIDKTELRKVEDEAVLGARRYLDKAHAGAA